MADSVNPPPKGWTKGTTDFEVRVICCPECGSLHVYHKGKSRATSTLVYWFCMTCTHRWKGSAVKITRAIVI